MSFGIDILVLKMEEFSPEITRVSTTRSRSTSPKKSRKITLDMLLSSVSLTRYGRESNENFLKRVTHLHLQNKNIAIIKGLDLCTNLKVS